MKKLVSAIAILGFGVGFVVSTSAAESEAPPGANFRPETLTEKSEYRRPVIVRGSDERTVVLRRDSEQYRSAMSTRIVEIVGETDPFLYVDLDGVIIPEGADLWVFVVNGRPQAITAGPQGKFLTRLVGDEASKDLSLEVLATTLEGENRRSLATVQLEAYRG